MQDEATASDQNQPSKNDHNNKNNNNNNQNNDDFNMHRENCACDLGLGLEYTDDEFDCLEALLLAHLQLSLRSGQSVGGQMGGVANGGHLLGLVAFARKIARVLLSLSLLCCILFLSFYLGSNYDGHNEGGVHIASSTTTTTTDLSLVDTSINSAAAAAAVHGNQPAESYSM